MLKFELCDLNFLGFLVPDGLFDVQTEGEKNASYLVVRLQFSAFWCVLMTINGVGVKPRECWQDKRVNSLQRDRKWRSAPRLLARVVGRPTSLKWVIQLKPSVFSLQDHSGLTRRSALLRRVCQHHIKDRPGRLRLGTQLEAQVFGVFRKVKVSHHSSAFH